MSAAGAGLFVAVMLTSAAATLVLARLAPSLGWTDGPRVPRKLQRRPVPTVGGLAILCALSLASPACWRARSEVLWAAWLPHPGWSLATLLLVFVLGTWDDRRPLAPLGKALGQLAALLPLVVGAWSTAGAAPALCLWLLAALALNLLNTFDNADGALASLCALGFAGPAPLVAAACLGFLPFNLDAARARNRASGAPTAYLGDAGAFALALFVVLVPSAAGLLLLPALDLARLSVVRWRAGSRPWRGDRRHLAHRLALRGLPCSGVAAVQCALAFPACLGIERALAAGESAAALAGGTLTLGLYALTLRLAPEPAAPR